MTSSGWFYQYIVRNRFINARYLEPRIRRHIRSHPEHVLDFGCGTGPMAYMFERGCYLGVDVDPVRIDLAKKFNEGHNFMCIERDSRLDFSGDTFEATIIIGVLHHMSDVECHRALQEICRVMGPTGRLIVMEPTLEQGGRLRNTVMKTFDKGKYLRHTSDYLEIIAKSFKCEIDGIFATPNLYRTALIKGVHK